MSSLASRSHQTLTWQVFVDQFEAITGIRPTFDSTYLSELKRLVDYLKSKRLRPFEERRREFLAHINWKFRLNAEPLGRFYLIAARQGFTFNYHQKCLVQRSFDLRDRELLESVLAQRGIPDRTRHTLLELFSPVEEPLTLEHLAAECREPSKLRKTKGDRDIQSEIIKAHFSAFMWVSLKERDMHRFFDPNDSKNEYRDSFWEQLHERSPHLFNRDNALHIVRIDQDKIRTFASIENLRDAISTLIARLFDCVNNYGFLAVLLEPIHIEGRSVEWEVAADITLFAEKHREVPLRKAYFRWERIRSDTVDYIAGIDVSRARFDLANEGFTYRDCFALASANQSIEHLLLIFQKNERDETPIACPTCRSMNVQGNSYSSLGVRSWECNNVLCPDRSKYNRGKRYSFRGLVMQQAIADSKNDIPVESVRTWTRDVLTSVEMDDVSEMLIRHYSFCGDTVHVHNWSGFPRKLFGRHIKHHSLTLSNPIKTFWGGPFFWRFAVPATKCAAIVRNLGDEDFQVLLGDSGEILRSLAESMFDGAVTSPPYYNARKYAQWANIYCYLHDMFDINREVYRTLKPGAHYLYNIFDYFDNERTIAFSAMGQRRMLLSAYTVDLFRRIGFELIGNIVWDKGDIEGKRGFNAGNFSPYYQSPFNCWEHILVFKKPASSDNRARSSEPIMQQIVGRVLCQQPVIKMVNGKNVHGHTAPFPDEIPEILISRLPPNSIVLDPFAGSLTTGRVADRHGLRSVCIERSEEYCRLGIRMRDRDLKLNQSNRSQHKLF